MGLRTARRAAALAVAAGLLSACGGAGSDSPPQVRVLVAGQDVSLQPTQYCDGGTGRRYSVQPPVIGVTPDTQITVTVPGEVARRGWSLQVFDQALEGKLGDVAVPAGADTFAVSSSDVVPATFYLVAVETSDRDRCSGLSGAWPVGFIRTVSGAPSS